MVEVPLDARLRFLIHDPPALTSISGDERGEEKEGESQGVDPDSVRIQLGTEVFESANRDAIETRVVGEDGHSLEVIFTPPGGLPEASVVALVLQAGNLSQIIDPPPEHARFMRDERIVFTTAGYGAAPRDVPNRGEWDGHTQPPSFAFALRKSASKDKQVRLAHHFALLDADVSHKHTVLFIHKPLQGRVHAVLGWTGVVWGFSGLNEAGFAAAVNTSDTLDNALVGQVLEDLLKARLVSTGVPAGIILRQLLTRSQHVEQARGFLEWEEATCGWNFLLADAQRNLAAVELDSNTLGKHKEGFRTYGPDPREPDNLDDSGRPYASVGEDDLRTASHFVKNTSDMDAPILIFQANPQRYWSTFYFRSLRAHHMVAEEIHARYGDLGRDEIIEILRRPELVDRRDSMNAVVFEPEKLTLHFAMGVVPATKAEFRRLRLSDYLDEEAR